MCIRDRDKPWDERRGGSERAEGDVLDAAKKVTGKPILILAKTVKGKGVSFMEGKNTWHGKAISDEDYKNAKEELGGAF